MDAFKGHMHASVYPLGFCEIVEIFKDKNHHIQLAITTKPIIMLYFVIVLYSC